MGEVGGDLVDQKSWIVVAVRCLLNYIMFLPWKKKNVKCKEKYSRLSSPSSRSDLNYRRVNSLSAQSQHVSSAPDKTWVFLAHLAPIRCAIVLNLQPVSLKISPYNHTASSRRLSIFKESRERPNIKSTVKITALARWSNSFSRAFWCHSPQTKGCGEGTDLYFDFTHRSGHTVRFCLQ